MEYIEFKKVNTSNLKNLNFEIKKGYLVNIIGENDSGKTSFLNVLSLEQSFDGSIIINDTEISKLNKIKLKKFIKKNISYYNDEFFLLKNLNVFDNAMLFTKDKSKVEIILKKLGLTKKTNSSINELSESEKIKLKFAITILKDSNIYIFDNILDKLDSKNKVLIMKILIEYAKKEDKIIILSNLNNTINDICNINIQLKKCKISSIKTNKKPKNLGDLKW